MGSTSKDITQMPTARKSRAASTSEEITQIPSIRTLRSSSTSRVIGISEAAGPASKDATRRTLPARMSRASSLTHLHAAQTSSAYRSGWNAQDAGDESYVITKDTTTQPQPNLPRSMQISPSGQLNLSK